VSNKVAVIVPKDNKANITTLKDLASPGVRIAYGASSIPINNYATQALNKMSNDSTYGADYKKNVLANVVSNETTVNFIVSKVALGEVDAGFVYVSDVPSEYKDKVTVITIPDRFQPTILWPIGVLKTSKSPAVAQDFINYVRSPEGNATMLSYGFVPV
jgi:molybdate transport system substrate-binding protein